MEYPKIRIDRTVFLRDGSKCYTVASVYEGVITIRKIEKSDFYYDDHYKNDLTYKWDKNKDIMVIMNDGKTEWERPKEEIWKEVTLDELIKIREPVKIRIVKEDSVAEGMFCICNSVCTGCKFRKSGYDCNTSDTLYMVNYKDSIKIEMKLEYAYVCGGIKK